MNHRLGSRRRQAGIITTISSAVPARLGAVRTTTPRGDRPPVTQSYAALSRVIKESGLPVIRAEELGDAAKKAVEAAKAA